MNYPINHSTKQSSASNRGQRNNHEQIYSGVIAAGSGSVSSTKIKKEIEGKRKKKFKKIEYLNKSKVGVSSIHATTALKIGSHTPNNPTGKPIQIYFLKLGIKNMYSQYNRKYKFTPAGNLNSTRAAKMNKPPLGVIHGSITSTGVTSFKHSRTRGNQALSGRDKTHI